MLLAVVSLKCSRPSVTFVILPLGKLTLHDNDFLFLPIGQYIQLLMLCWFETMNKETNLKLYY